MKNLICILMALGSFIALSSSAIAMEKFITYGSGTLGGTLHIIAVGGAKIFNECLKGEARVNVQSTACGAETTRLVGKMEVHMSNCPDIPCVTEGYEGKGRFKGEKYPDLRALCSFPYGPTHIFTLVSSGIKSVRDFRGKRISLGGAGSAGATLAESILKSYGIDPKKDIVASYQTITAQASAIRDGAIDGGFVFTPGPIGPFTEVALSKPIRLLPIDEPQLNELLKEIPGSARMVHPAKIYKGVDQDIISIGNVIIFVVNSKVSEEMVYRLTKCLWENLEEFHEVHPLAKSFQKKTALDQIPIPLHKGAERYYREAGMIK